MNLSHEWLKAFVPHALSAEQVRDLLTAHVATVEGFERLRADLAPFVVARVIETEKVPDTKLSFNKVDDGSGTLLEVVCGAPNVTAGAVYPFARTGTLMPAGFKIEKKKIRGFTSNGMLCSAAELGLGEDHAGILELTTDAAPGTPLLDVLPLGDVRLVLDVLPNRPDLLSHLGVARELSALTGVPLQDTDGPHAAPTVAVVRDAKTASSGGATVQLEDAEGCPQYLGAVVRGVTVGPSPAWLRERVEAAGVRSINNVVDVTNAILHGLGHPMHAFDLATLADQTVVIRRARAGEKMKTLDGVERALTPEMTMIADAARSVAVAGVMGGQESEVTATTTDLFLEVAYFDPKRTRRTRRALGLSTDASYRFERGIDPNGLVDAMRAAIGMIVAVAGGQLDGSIMAVGAGPAPRAAVGLRPARVQAVLGAPITEAEVTRYLSSVGFRVLRLGEGEGMEKGWRGEDVVFSVTPPSWRHDVTREVDLIEEVARLHGYDKLPDTIEAYRPTTVPDHPLYVTGRRVRDALVAAGLAEVRPMPFVKGDDATHWRVTNPLAEDEPHLRVSVLESLARRAEYNLTRMKGDIRLFEVGSVFLGKGKGAERGAGKGEIAEEVRVGVVIMGARQPHHFADASSPVIDAWDAKGLAERVARTAFPGAVIAMESADDPALWTITVDARAVGTVSRVTLDAPIWASAAFGIELTLGAMPVAYVAKPGESVHAGVRPAIAPPAPAVRYTPLPTTPAATFDLALLVPDALSAAEVERVLRTSGGDMLESLALFDEFRGAGVPDGMRSLAWRLTFRHPERTLRDKEIDGRRSQLLKSLENQLGVKPRTA
ncbi:MAG: phenylalanine--tRNA ligase subunit beta [Gemmatimonadetes bacterium]|nr:phenylalanine--tRNA ligase subunit beta [Gemmatimonadota bacterium]